MSHKQSDVLVVGAGPVGLFAALSLAKRGIETRIVDAQWRTASRSYAMALHPRSIALLEEAGVAPDVLAQGRKIERIALYADGSRQAELDYSKLTGKHPYVLVLPQSALESGLEEAFQASGGSVDWNHRLEGLAVSDTGAEARLDVLTKFSTGYSVSQMEWGIEETIRHTTGFVVGCDGHRSTTRRHLGVEFEARGGPELLAVFEFRSGDEIPNEAQIAFAGDGVSVLWPMPDGRCRWGFPLDPAMEIAGERVKSRLAVQVGVESYPWLGADMLSKAIARRAPWFKAGVAEVLWAMVVRFESRLASRLGQGRAWLAGDSAHVGGPVGAHSMNQGFREAHDLAERIHEVLRGGASSAMLRDYGAHWTDEWKGTLAPCAATSPGGEWAKPYAAELVSRIPASGDGRGALMEQIGFTVER